MKRATVITVLATALALAPWARPQGTPAETKPNLQELTRDLQRFKKSDGRIVVIHWLPEPFWRVTQAADPSMSPAQVEAMARVAREYVIILVASGRILADGNYQFESKEDVRKRLSLVDRLGRAHAPVPETKLDDEAKQALSVERELGAAMGPLGASLYVFLFPGTDGSGVSIADPRAEGRFSVKIGDESYVEDATRLAIAEADVSQVPRGVEWRIPLLPV
jgi:hypothetical protein